MKLSPAIFTLIAMVIVLASCKKTDSNPCIEERIDIFVLEACETGATVNQYMFQNETVYTLQLGNCIADAGEEVLDAECNTIGFLGGLGGTSDINGENFYANAVLETTIWSN